MAQIETSPSLIKAALIKGYRVGIFYTHEDTIVEYHFIKDPRDAFLSRVTCVMYTSTTSDPLRLCGVTQTIKDFVTMIEKPVMYVNYYVPYKLTHTSVFPGDWYPCFENAKETRIEGVKKEIPALQELANKIAEEDRKIEEEQRKKQEEERKRREEEFKKIEEARRNRTSSLTRIENMLGRGGIPLVARDLTDDDVAEMLAKGFFNTIN
jgi:hypothetical protein